MRLNILGMDNCFEAARLLGVNRVVYASSIAVSRQQSNFGDSMVNEDDRMFGLASTQLTRYSTSSRPRCTLKTTDWPSPACGPANVTGPDKVRSSEDHVRCITRPNGGESVNFPYKSLMRLPIHVEDIAEVFTRVLLADSSHYLIYNSSGHPISLGDLAAIVQEYLPDAQITFDSERGLEQSGSYMEDNSRLREEFEVEYPPFHSGA